MVAYTCNAFQVALASLSHSLLLRFLRSDSSCTLLHHFIHAAVFRFIRLLTAHTQLLSMAFINTRTPIIRTEKSTCFTPFRCSLHDQLRSTSLHSFSPVQCYPLSMFVLACAACFGFVFVIVFANTQKPTHESKTTAKHSRIT